MIFSLPLFLINYNFENLLCPDLCFRTNKFAGLEIFFTFFEREPFSPTPKEAPFLLLSFRLSSSRDFGSSVVVPQALFNFR